ncbi:MAG: 30S ribosomal protein S17 [Planctomycetes bacterium]|jgi:small subunit ribosomal protein S17|nr:30S ribosomal protein S17 [Planctomycetota bacterium]
MSSNPVEAKSGSGGQAAGASERNERKVMRGTVTSNKMQKTLVVQVDRKVKHPLYEKFISKRTKLYAHDEKNEAQVGDVVEVTQTRPLSKLKCWRLLRIVQKAPQA